MKYLSKIVFIFLSIWFLWACQEKAQIITPINNTPIDTTKMIKEPEPTLESFLVASPTKEPYVEILDGGFEATLVIANIDKDNQVNGKIAVEDIRNIETLYLYPTYYTLPLDTINPNKTSALIKKYMGSNFINENSIVVKNLKGIEGFTSLTSLEFGGIILDTLDLSKSTKLREIRAGLPQFKHLNVSGCKDLIKLDVGISYFYSNTTSKLEGLELSENTKLEELHYSTSSANKLDLSKNTNIRLLDLRGCESLGEINLCNNSKLESVQTTNSSIKNIYVSKEVFARIDTLKTFVAEGLTLPLWAKNTNAQWGVCK